MSSISHHRRSANEKTMEELQADTVHWDFLFQSNTEEMFFLKQLLTSNVFENNIPKLFENLQNFFTELEDLKEEKIELHEVLRNHKNDLNGMMECEDISCESFYYSQHKVLANRIQDHLLRFQKLKIAIFKFCAPLLKRNSQ